MVLSRHVAILDCLLLQDWQEHTVGGVRGYITTWLERAMQAPSTLSGRKLPVCWVYSGTIHSIEVNAALRDLAKGITSDGGNLVVLTPEDLGAPKASNKLAKLIHTRLSSSKAAPGSHFTLKHVAELCAERMRKCGTISGLP